MAKKAEDLYREALALSEEEREALIGLLTMTTDSGPASPEVEKAWLEEAERRHHAVLNGTEQLVPGEEVMRELRELVGK